MFLPGSYGSVLWPRENTSTIKYKKKAPPPKKWRRWLRKSIYFLDRYLEGAPKSWSRTIKASAKSMLSNHVSLKFLDVLAWSQPGNASDFWNSRISTGVSAQPLAQAVVVKKLEQMFSIRRSLSYGRISYVMIYASVIPIVLNKKNVGFQLPPRSIWSLLEED